MNYLTWFLLDRGDIVAEDNHNVFDSDSENEDEVPAQYEPGTREDVLQLKKLLRNFGGIGGILMSCRRGTRC